MTTANTSTFEIVLRLVALLIALFGASARCVARVMAMRDDVRPGFGRLVARAAVRGVALVRAGEDDATVDKRLGVLEWIAADRRRAVRHMARATRGLMRVRLGGCAAPPAFAPPRLACAALADGVEVFATAPDT